MKKLLFLFLPFFLISCSEPEQEKETRITPAHTIREITILDNSAIFTVSCAIPTPCWEFHSYDVITSNNDYYITFYVKSTDQSVCPQYISSLNAYYNVDVNESGEYRFHFYKTDSSSIDTTILFP